MIDPRTGRELVSPADRLPTNNTDHAGRARSVYNPAGREPASRASDGSAVYGRRAMLLSSVAGILSFGLLSRTTRAAASEMAWEFDESDKTTTTIRYRDAVIPAVCTGMTMTEAGTLAKRLELHALVEGHQWVTGSGVRGRFVWRPRR